MNIDYNEINNNIEKLRNFNNDFKFLELLNNDKNLKDNDTLNYIFDCFLNVEKYDFYLIDYLTSFFKNFNKFSFKSLIANDDIKDKRDILLTFKYFNFTKENSKFLRFDFDDLNNIDTVRALQRFGVDKFNYFNHKTKNRLRDFFLFYNDEYFTHAQDIFLYKLYKTTFPIKHKVISKSVIQRALGKDFFGVTHRGGLFGEIEYFFEHYYLSKFISKEVFEDIKYTTQKSDLSADELFIVLAKQYVDFYDETINDYIRICRKNCWFLNESF